MKTLLQQLLAIENFDVFLVLGILIGFGLIESFAGYLRNSKRKKGDWFQEVFSFFFLSTGIKPAIVASITGPSIMKYIAISKGHSTMFCVRL